MNGRIGVHTAENAPIGRSDVSRPDLASAVRVEKLRHFFRREAREGEEVVEQGEGAHLEAATNSMFVPLQT